MRACRSIPFLAGLTLLAACATPPPTSEPDALADYKQTNDPLEPTNRVFYAVNNGIDAVILRPLAVGYTYAVPLVFRTHIHNVLENLNDPVIFVNDMMEGKPRRAGDTFMRLVLNSTLGLGGIFDVADDIGYPMHEANFGITLATWGVPAGPFLYLPVIGPSDPRDAFGYGTDVALDPFTWAGTSSAWLLFDYTRYGMELVDIRASLLTDLDKVKEQALDPYATFRSLYRQHVAAQIEKVRTDDRATTPLWYDHGPTN